MKGIRVLSPGGSLGYGVNADSLRLAVDEGVDVLGADSGSTDMGAVVSRLGEALSLAQDDET